jgi:hypothetical protein
VGDGSEPSLIPHAERTNRPLLAGVNSISRLRTGFKRDSRIFKIPLAYAKILNYPISMLPANTHKSNEARPLAHKLLTLSQADLANPSSSPEYAKQLRRLIDRYCEQTGIKYKLCLNIATRKFGFDVRDIGILSNGMLQELYKELTRVKGEEIKEWKFRV